MNSDEMKDIIHRIHKLNNNVFKHDVFNFDRLADLDYLDTVFTLRNYHYHKNDELFRRTNKERVKQYKNNTKATVSREDVAMLSFFKRVGVL